MKTVKADVKTDSQGQNRLEAECAECTRTLVRAIREGEERMDGFMCVCPICQTKQILEKK